MSQTISVGVVGPSHWSYMAAVMAASLGRMADSHRVNADDIPRGVYADAQRFFHLVLQQFQGRAPENPPASINAYVLAAEAARGGLPSALTRQCLQERLKRYGQFMELLREPRELEGPQAEEAQQLCQFFQRIRKAGQAESYERRVRFEPGYIQRR